MYNSRDVLVGFPEGQARFGEIDDWSDFQDQQVTLVSNDASLVRVERLVMDVRSWRTEIDIIAARRARTESAIAAAERIKVVPR